MFPFVTGLHDWWADKGVHNVSHEPYKVFHPHIWSYLHGTGGGTVKTAESDVHTRTSPHVHPYTCTLRRYHCYQLIYGLRSNIRKGCTWHSTTHHREKKRRSGERQTAVLLFSVLSSLQIVQQTKRDDDPSHKHIPQNVTARCRCNCEIR